MTQIRGMFGPSADAGPERGGGTMPSLRPHYPQHVREALHALAEARPPWPEYLRLRRAILERARR